MRYFLLGVLGVGLSGCALPMSLQIASMAASGISYIATGKGVSDHAISAVASQDCAIHRIALGQGLCNTIDIETDGTAIALIGDEQQSPPARNSSERLRESMLSLAGSLQEDLQPLSGPNGNDIPVSNETETRDSVSGALFAAEEAIKDIKSTIGSNAPTLSVAASQHYLILGRFQELNRAEQTRIRHTELGATIRMVLNDGNLLFQVTAGPFTQTEALNAVAAITEDYVSPKVAQLCSDRVTPAPCSGDQNDITVQLTTRPFSESSR